MPKGCKAVTALKIDGCQPGRVRDRIAKWRSAFDRDRDRRDKIRPAVNVTASYIAGRGMGSMAPLSIAIYCQRLFMFLDSYVLWSTELSAPL